MGPRELRLRQSIENTFLPEYYELENESHQHGARQLNPKLETHFRLLVVSAVFEGKSRLDRSRLVNEMVAGEMATGLHALSQRTMTPSEWSQVKDTFVMVSPECRGGSKRS